LKQAGFELERPDECLQVAFSPTECSMVRLADNHKLVWSKLRYSAGDLGTTRKDAPFSATVAALTVTLSGAIGLNSNYDDVLAIMRSFGGGHSVWTTVITELVRMNKAYLDYNQLEPDAAQQAQSQLQVGQQQPPQQPDALTNAILGASLSLIGHMGFCGEYKVRPHVCQMASLILMAKSTAMSAMYALSISKSPQPINPFDEPESVEVFAGNAKWALDLYSWIVSSIEDLRRDDEFMGMLMSRERVPQLHHYLSSKSQPVIHYMLCSATRGILMSLARRMAPILTYAAQAAEYIRKSPSARPQTPVQVAYLEIHRVVEESPVKLADFQLLANLFASESRDKYRAYRASALNMAQQQARDSQTPFNAKRAEDAFRQRVSEFEVNFMLGGPITPPWIQAVHGVMKQFPAFLDGTYVPPASAAPQQPQAQPSSTATQQQQQQQPAQPPPPPTASGRVTDQSKLFTGAVG
jgi:mediator of RNA polymerase II transcription subunit 16